MTASRVGGWAAVVFMAAMIWMLFPDRDVRREMQEEITRVSLAEEIPQEQARTQMEAIKTEAERLHSQGLYSGTAYFSHLKQLEYLAKYSRQGGHLGIDGMMFGTGRTREYCLSLFRDQSRSILEREIPKLHALVDTDREFKRLDAFVPYEVKWHWSPLFAYLARVYPLTVLLALLYHLGVLAFRKRSMLAELVAPDRLLRASVFWPIHFWYETREPREQFKRAGYAVAYAIAGAICFLPVSVRGQTTTDGASKKRTNHSLQLDLRSTSYLGDGGPPDPNLFGRATFYSGSLVVENITTANPELGQWYTELGAGVAIVNNTQARINALVIASQNQRGTRRLMAGVQAFIPWRRGMLAVPVMRFERDLDTGAGTLAFATNPTIKAGLTGWRSRLAFAPDLLIRKTEGQPITWNAGAGVRFNHWRRDQVEVGILRNSHDQIQLRGRAILNFAF